MADENTAGPGPADSASAGASAAVSFDSRDLREALAQLLPVLPKLKKRQRGIQTRHYQNSLLFDFNSEDWGEPAQLNIVACDGHMLALLTFDLSHPQSGRYLLRAEDARLLLKFTPDSPFETATLFFGPAGARVERNAEGVQPMKLELLDAKYPDYWRIFWEPEPETAEINIDPAKLARAAGKKFLKLQVAPRHESTRLPPPLQFQGEAVQGSLANLRGALMPIRWD